ncbi:MAG: SMC-Scp complex subunit ScpB [Gammaproteobacteria bacterium]|nr:SMC-Scp complex subunit ScpB [Gammaproteobacteria bacterium]
MEIKPLKLIVESILLAAGRPLTLDQLLAMFDDKEKPERADLREAIKALQDDYAERGIDLVQVGGGYRIQVRESMQPWVARLWEEKPARYSRALLETLSLIAYRQPITRGEIESVRGVAVSTSIVKTLLEREWVHVVGHRDVPGRPAMYGTTKQFLNYFGLKNIDGLPSLAELRDLNAIGEELQLDLAEIPGLGMESANDEAGDELQEETADSDAEDLGPPQDAAAEENTATLH